MRTLDAQFELFNVAHVSGWGLGRREKTKTALPSADGLRRKGAESGNRFFSQRPSRTLRPCVKPVFPRGIISHPPEWGMRQGSEPPGWWRSGGAGENEKQWERSKGVLENKGHHFFDGCKSCAFCVQISTNSALKGAKTARFAQNEANVFTSQGEAGIMTKSRLDWPSICQTPGSRRLWAQSFALREARDLHLHSLPRRRNFHRGLW